MKVLTVDFDLIVQSMRDLSRQSDDYYFDKNTGKIYALSRALIQSLVQERSEEIDLLPEWDSRMIPLAREIVLIGSARYIRVPEAFGCPQHKWMADFARGISVKKLKEKLNQALQGRGSCKRFKEILRAYPLQSRDWVEYHQKRWQEHVEKWLESLSIIAVSDNPKKIKSAA